MSGNDLFLFSGEKTGHLKRKILLLLTLVITSVATIVTIYNILHERQLHEQQISQAYTSVELSYEETIRDTVHFYTSRARTNLDSPGVREAFKRSDRDELYRLIEARWKILREENPQLRVMHFHKADGTSLLRMHQPEIYGDTISLKRPMVAYVHRTHRPAMGFEEGREGFGLRMLTPIVEGGRYLGALEFGLSASYLTDKIYRHTGYHSFFLTDAATVGNLAHVGKHYPVGNYMAIDVPEELRPLVELYAQNTSDLSSLTLTYQGRPLAMIAVPLTDYQNRPKGAVVFILPIPDFWAHAVQMITASAVIALILILLLGGAIGKMYDIVATKLRFQELYNQTVLDAVPSPVIVTDGHQIIAANRTFLGFFRYSNIESFKKEHACVCDFFEEGDTKDYLMPVIGGLRWTDYINSNPAQNHKAKITMEGKTTVFDVKLAILRFKEQERYVVIFTDISAMQALSMTDLLTGIANRLHFTMVYEHTVNLARRDQKPLGIIFFDIDHFKQVNDRYGHLAGDGVLKKIASLVKLRIRKSDIIARWGGEEFIILLPDTPLSEAALLAETVRKTIENEPFDEIGKITCSFGVAALREGESSDSLLKRADDLLYSAKTRGRNQVVQG